MLAFIALKLLYSFAAMVLQLTRIFSRRGNARANQSEQRSNDRNHNQQFNKRKTLALATHDSPPRSGKMSCRQPSLLIEFYVWWRIGGNRRQFSAGAVSLVADDSTASSV